MLEEQEDAGHSKWNPVDRPGWETMDMLTIPTGAQLNLGQSLWYWKSKMLDKGWKTRICWTFEWEHIWILDNMLGEKRRKILVFRHGEHLIYPGSSSFSDQQPRNDRVHIRKRIFWLKSFDELWMTQQENNKQPAMKGHCKLYMDSIGREEVASDEEREMDILTGANRRLMFFKSQLLFQILAAVR
jgi:hypothetical protein